MVGGKRRASVRAGSGRGWGAGERRERTAAPPTPQHPDNEVTASSSGSLFSPTLRSQAFSCRAEGVEGCGACVGGSRRRRGASPGLITPAPRARPFSAPRPQTMKTRLQPQLAPARPRDPPSSPLAEPRKPRGAPQRVVGWVEGRPRQGAKASLPPLPRRRGG